MFQLKSGALFANLKLREKEETNKKNKFFVKTQFLKNSTDFLKIGRITRVSYEIYVVNYYMHADSNATHTLFPSTALQIWGTFGANHE